MWSKQMWQLMAIICFPTISFHVHLQPKKHSGEALVKKFLYEQWIIWLQAHVFESFIMMIPPLHVQAPAYG